MTARVAVKLISTLAISLTLSLLCAIDVAAQTPQPLPTFEQLIKTEYDSNKDVTQISLNPFVLATSKLEELRLGVVSGYKGKTKTVPTDCLLFFFSLTKTDQNKYDPARKLTITADDQRLELGETNRSKQAQNGVFVESMLINVKMEDFLRISRAKTVKIKLGITEVNLTPEQIKLLKLTASYLTE